MNIQDNDSLLADEGAGYLISVSDMMAGLLFIFIITLVAFAINFQDATDRADVATREAQEEAVLAEEERDRLQTTVDDLTNAQRLRSEMLADIRRALDAQGIRVEVDEEHGVLRLTENAVLFPTGEAELPLEERWKLDTIGEVLALVLPCYTATPPPDLGCQTSTQGKLEAVFVEGHTDNVPIRGRFEDNWDLSAQRALYTYRGLISSQPSLAELANLIDQPIFSVSGYGDNRPINAHVAPTADPVNRRIDLRFIMTPPRADAEVIQVLREGGVR